MRIAVDMHFLQDKHQGIRTVLTGLYEALCKKRSTGHEYLFVFTRPDLISEYWSQYGEVAFTGDMSRSARLAYGMARTIRHADKVDLSHFNAVVPLGVPGKVMVSIHDMLFITYPQYFHFSFRMKQRLAATWSMRRADIITSVSDYTLRTMSDLFPRRSDRFRMLRNGVCIEDYELDLAKARGDVEKAYGLRNFMLTVGRIDPRKNHQNMLEAFNLLAQRLSPQELPTFVIVGEIDNDFDDGRNLIEDMQAKLPIVWLRDVDDSMLRSLYRAARLVVMASYAEGFGLPLLEAMSAGTPVIAGDNTAMPEVLAGCGLLADSHSPERIADCYDRIITDERFAAECEGCGRERAHSLTWEKAADTYLEILDEIARPRSETVA